MLALRTIHVHAMTDPLDLFVVTFAIAGLIVIAWLLGAFAWI
jgi:hypothetical protein